LNVVICVFHSSDGGDEMRLLEEERFNASDEDEDGLLNFPEYKE